MTYLMGRQARIGLVALVAAIATAGFGGSAVAAQTHKARPNSPVYQSHAQLASRPPAQPAQMHYYGGPKSPMWR
jgi:hypothetical protein